MTNELQSTTVTATKLATPGSMSAGWPPMASALWLGSGGERSGVSCASRRRDPGERGSGDPLSEDDGTAGVPDDPVIEDPSGGDPATEDAPEADPTPEGTRGDEHAEDDPITRERVADEPGGRT